jgi:hypothetical protein
MENYHISSQLVVYTLFIVVMLVVLTLFLINTKKVGLDDLVLEMILSTT